MTRNWQSEVGAGHTCACVCMCVWCNRKKKVLIDTSVWPNHKVDMHTRMGMDDNLDVQNLFLFWLTLKAANKKYEVTNSM